MKNNDRIKVKGIFHINIFKKGVLIDSVTEDNLVVDLGLNQLAQLLGGGSDFEVNRIGFGEGTASPAAGDTGLTNAYVKLINTVTYPSTGEVRFNWSLETTEGNGMSITEFGLFFNIVTLFSRKTRAVIEKDSDIRLEGYWSINF